VAGTFGCKKEGGSLPSRPPKTYKHNITNEQPFDRHSVILFKAGA
jgi:hypothetical protein